MGDDTKQLQVGKIEFSDPLARPLVKRLVTPPRTCSGTMFAQHAPITYGHELDACPFCAEVSRLRAELSASEEREKGLRDAMLLLRRKRVWQSFKPGAATYTLLCAECDRPIDAEGNCDGAGCVFALLSA